MERISGSFCVYWCLHIISLVLSIVITIIFWAILYNANEYTLSATNILTHALNSVWMFLDLLIVAHPLRLLHIFMPLLFGVVYALFTFVYHLCGGVNRNGKPYIYRVLNWNKPEDAMITVFATLILTCCIYMILFTIYKIRIMLHRHLRRMLENRNATTIELPTQEQWMQQGQWVQLSERERRQLREQMQQREREREQQAALPITYPEVHGAYLRNRELAREIALEASRESTTMRTPRASHLGMESEFDNRAFTFDDDVTNM